MAKKNTANEMELATLALAKALVEGDRTAAHAALSSGAYPEAFWIDGRTTLRQLAKTRGPASISKAIEKLFSPETLRKLLPMTDDPARWSQSFVEFVAMRGYDFQGKTNTLSRLGGSPIRPVNTAKAGVRLIKNKWKLIESASCRMGRESNGSKFDLLFGAQWNGDRRIVGFSLSFQVDAPGWDLVEMFDEAVKSGRQFDWPDPSDAMLNNQKSREGEEISDQLLCRGYKGLDDIIGCLRKGGSPFFKWDGKFLGEFDNNLEDKAFMDALRDAIGPQEGWHHRITPLLTKDGIAALKAKAALKLSTPQAKTRKKSLKDRTDIM